MQVCERGEGVRVPSEDFALGNREEGYEWMAKAFQDRCFELVAAKVDPRFDPLRDDARFRQLSAHLGIA